MISAILSPQLLEKMSQKLRDQQHKPGLYVVATPIGNIFDISFRAIHILKEAKYIFAEDTRQSKKLLNFYDIKTPLISCHEHNEESSVVTSKIKEEDIYALISDAGTPLISDPGYRIVNWCVEHRIDVFPVPGASALTAGLSVAGLPTNSFAFHGFLPPKAQSRRSALRDLRNAEQTIVFLESPRRLLNSLGDMLEIFGNRYACVCREMTKIFEEFRRGNLSELIEYFSNNEPVGEFVVIVSGNRNFSIDETAIFSELSKSLDEKTLKNAVEEISHKYGLSKKTIYRKALEIQGEKQ
ncbi:MAG: 16S rRNA (cytidine(1402)-2'-O)-methyltransferase [Holosporaceae bacterium]|nr:16S rRNA (cytidine(1402)-2'-O)-methyltransferase [Holosporaceae bacterium]